MDAPRQRPLLALALRLGAMAMLATMMMLVKLAGTRGISLTETMFWRQFIPAGLLLGWLGARGECARLRTQRFGAHLRRSAIGLTGMFLTLGAARLLPLAEATVLGFTTPLFAVMLAALVLRERVGAIRWSAVALGFAGVLVIAGPDRANLPPAGLAVGIGAAFFVALIAIQLRDLGRTETPVAVVFWFSCLSAIALAPSLAWSARAHDAREWAMLAGIGLTGLAAQLGLTAALRFGPVSSVIVMDYSSFAWATLWGWLVFAQLPPATIWLGAPLIVFAGLVVVWRERRLALEKPQMPTG